MEGNDSIFNTTLPTALPLGEAEKKPVENTNQGNLN